MNEKLQAGKLKVIAYLVRLLDQGMEALGNVEEMDRHRGLYSSCSVLKIIPHDFRFPFLLKVPTSSIRTRFGGGVFGFLQSNIDTGVHIHTPLVLPVSDLYPLNRFMLRDEVLDALFKQSQHPSI